MAALTHRVDMRKTIKLRLTVPRLFGFRMWLTIQLLKLIGYISPLDLALDYANSDELRLPEHRTYQWQTTETGETVTIPNQSAVGDPNFDAELARRLDIYLDGVKQDQVVAYDADAGLIRRHVLDSNGKPQLNSTRDAALRETVRGKVEIVLAR